MCAICWIMSLRYACTSCFGRGYAVKFASTSAVTKVQLQNVPAVLTRNVEKCLEEGVMYIWLKSIISFRDNEDTVISLRGFIWNSLCLLLCRALPTPTQAVWVLWYPPVRSGRPMCVSLYSGCKRGMTGFLLNGLFTKYYEVFLSLNLRYALYSEKRKGWRAHWIFCPYSARRYDVAHRYQRIYCVLNRINRNAKSGTGQDPILFYDFSFKYNIRRWRIFAFLLYWESQPYYRSQCSFPNNPKDLERRKILSPIYSLCGHGAILVPWKMDVYLDATYFIWIVS